MKELGDGDVFLAPLSLEDYCTVWLHLDNDELHKGLADKHLGEVLKLHGVYSYNMHKNSKVRKLRMLKDMNLFNPMRSTLRSSTATSAALADEEFATDLRALGW